MKQEYEGIILKGIDGFYYVDTEDGVFQCRARGLFRKQKVTPLAGDRVKIIVGTMEDESTVQEILPRSNCFLRPPVANVDQLYIVSSLLFPRPNFYLIDLMTAVAVFKDVHPTVVFTKTDLLDQTEYVDTYRRAGIDVVSVCGLTGEGMEQVASSLQDGIAVFTGNTGVGKSTLLNALMPELQIETGDVSRKLNRGRHTTRECTLYPFRKGYIVDTAGFASIDNAGNGEFIPKDKLAGCFPDFSHYLDGCKYASCTHTVEQGCAVLSALHEGKIVKSRHESYCRLYEEAKSVKEWKRRQRNRGGK